MIAEENPRTAQSDSAFEQRASLILRCAKSVMEELAAGRHVDPMRVQWARAVIAANGRTV